MTYQRTTYRWFLIICGLTAFILAGCASTKKPGAVREEGATARSADDLIVTHRSAAEVMSLDATAAPHEPNMLYLCTFNVYKLGSVEEKYTSLEEEGEETDAAETGTPDRIKNLTNVLTERPLDLIVFQEVTAGIRGEAAMADLASELHQRTGEDYLFFLSDYIGQGLMAEAIAFLYKPSVVKPELLPGSTALVENIEIPGRDLVRTQWEAGDFDFTLIAGHLAWGNEADRDAGYEKIEEILWTETPSAFSDDEDIIVLGDFNRLGAGYDSVKELTFNADIFLAPNITFFDPAFSAKKSVTTTSIAGKGVPNDNPQLVLTTVAQNKNVYDMMLPSIDVLEEFPPGTGEAVYDVDFGIIHFDEPPASGGVGCQEGARDLVHNVLKEEYSDHRPLWMRFKTNAGTADDPPGGVDLTPLEPHEEYVATEYGGRFHRPACWTIRDRVIHRRWESREAAASELPPCGVCKP